MFDEQFRRVFPALAASPVRLLARAGATPNQITLAACALGCVAAWLLASGRGGIAIIIWLASRVLDGLDGLLARETGRGSAFGGYLDITLDMLAYGAMIVGFAVAHPSLAIGWIAVLLGYLLVTTSTLALSSLLEAHHARAGLTNRSIAFTPGFAEAGETSLVYVLLVLLPAATSFIVWGWVALLAATVVQRTLFARRTLGEL